MGDSSSIRTTLFLIATAACGHPPTSATPTAPSVPPAELKIPGLDEYRGDPRFHADRIYLYGRSPNHIAFVNEPADEACGCYQPTIVLQDLRRGTVVWTDRYDSEKAPATEQWRTIDELWRARGAEWEQRLRSAGVQRESAISLATTIPTGGTNLPRFELRTEKVDDKSSEGYEHLTSYRLDLVKSATDTTTIAQAASETTLIDVGVLGVVPQNDDGAAAVLVLEKRHGFENATLHRVRVVGADVRVEPN